MGCKNARAFFSEYYDGDGDESRDMRFESHIGECQNCSAEYSEYTDMLQTLAGMEEPEVPDGFRESLVAGIIGYEKGRRTTMRLQGILGAASTVLAAAAAVMMIVYMGQAGQIEQLRQIEQAGQVAETAENEEARSGRSLAPISPYAIEPDDGGEGVSDDIMPIAALSGVAGPAQAETAGARRGFLLPSIFFASIGLALGLGMRDLLQFATFKLSARRLGKTE